MSENETTPAQRVRAFLTVSAQEFVTAGDTDFIRRIGPVKGKWYDLTRSDLEAVLEERDSLVLKAHFQARQIADLQEDSDRLNALEAHGVDNWEGYGTAMQSLDDE